MSVMRAVVAAALEKNRCDDGSWDYAAKIAIAAVRDVLLARAAEKGWGMRDDEPFETAVALVFDEANEAN